MKLLPEGSLTTHSQTHKHNRAHSIINCDTDKCTINEFYNDIFPDENAFFIDILECFSQVAEKTLTMWWEQNRGQ